jgi:hypothetical protein
MAWSGSDLALQIESAFSTVAGSHEPPYQASEFQNVFASTLQAYIIAGYKLSGTYAGTIAGPSSDPADGEYIWESPSASISGSELLTAANISFTAWLASLTSQMSLISFSGKSHISAGFTITLNSPVSPVVPALSVTFASSETPSSAMLKVCNAIITGLNSATAPVSVSADSSDSGSGAVSAMSFSGS